MEYEVEGRRPRGRPKRTWREVVWEVCQARKMNKEDAMDRCKWRKMIKRMSDDQVGCEWVSVSSGTGLPGLSRTKAVKRLCVSCVACVCLLGLPKSQRTWSASAGGSISRAAGSYTSDKELFCCHLVAGDKMWIYHWAPLSKLEFMQWKDVDRRAFTQICKSAINWLD